MKKIIGLLSVFILLYSLPIILAGDDKEVVVDLQKYEKATFAGGCFWCVQPPYDKLNGVVKTTVGYTGGQEKNPTYKQVSYGKTTHTESIEVVFDPAVVSYEQLLDVFWMNIDPTDIKGQFVDRGSQYRPEIFYHSENQRIIAENSKQKLEKSGRFDKPVVVPITPASQFWKGEDYHQKYYKKSPVSYYAYRRGSGRDQFIEKYWSKK
jgi:methionine-S-sulfoxide reductase